ncbi:MAG: RNA methyltransferase [Clostridiales bacterium]|nr:RNA methyltransferase [Clostridiales bacterium]
MTVISSVQNDKIKHAAKLSQSASFRRENKEFIIEGARLCSDAAKSGVEIITCFFTPDAANKYPEYIDDILKTDCEEVEITAAVSSKLSDTMNSQGIFCVCGIDENNSGFDYTGRYIALENIQDPSNLGAISRTAEATGLSGVIIFGGCDRFNPKAIRASMGSLFRLNVFTFDDAADFIRRAGSEKMSTFACVPDRAAKDIRTIDFSAPCVSFIGNEGNGLSKRVIDLSDERMTIPMKGRAESFNAAAAAAIIAWEMTK